MDELRARLQRRLDGMRVAVYGDSIVRQFYEMLACFLGLDAAPPEYRFLGAELPPPLEEAQRIGKVALDKIRVMWPPDPNARGHQKGASGQPYSSVNTSWRDGGPVHRPRSYEFWHADTLGGFHEAPGVDPTSVTADSDGRFFEGNTMLRWLATHADLVFTNTAGLHHSPCDATGRQCDRRFVRDIWGVARACSRQLGSLGRRGVDCVLMEVPPQHFATGRGANGSTGLWLGGAESRFGCAPIDPEMRGVAWRAYNHQVRAAASRWNVPVARIWHRLADEWQWHIGGADCTHWCSDDHVFSKWVMALDEALTEAGAPGMVV